MSQNYNNIRDPNHGSPQNGAGHGYDLLSSLVSPRLTTHIPSETAWPGMQGWEAPMQAPFGTNMQFPGQVLPFPQQGFIQDMQQEDYIALGEDEESYDPEYNPSLPHQPTATVPSVEKKKAPPPIDSQKKAAELRAKLLANRPQSAASGRSNTPNKSKDLPIQTKNKPKEQLGNGKPGRKDSTKQQASAQGSAGSAPSAAGMPGQHASQDGMSADIENLLAEGRDAADGKQTQPLTAKDEKVSMKPGPLAFAAPQYTKPTTTEEKGETQDRTASSSDEEGEIRGDSTQPTSIDQPLKSVESRQDTTTEAQEKLDRQKETKSVYGAMKHDKAKPANVPTTQDISSKTTTSKDTLVSPTAVEGLPAKPVSPKTSRDHQHTARGRNAAYDSYKPSRDSRREPDMGDDVDPRRRYSDQERRTAGPQVSAKESTRLIRDQLAAKEKELADLKHATQAARNREGHKDESALFQPPNVRRDAEAIEAMLIDDRDLADWLEMTEYHDEDYRKRKLSRFRKKRELDAARAELEREDQMELEERSHRAQTTVSPPNNVFSPSVLRRASIATIAHTKMPPPPLPLQPRRESNSDGPSMASTPTLKRQHAELDTDARPVEKFARTDTNGNHTRGSSPATSVKGEPLSARFPPPLEDRIFRNDDFFDRRYPPPPRRRSPSPNYVYRPDSRDRRRSYSPRSRGGGFNPNPLAPDRPFHKVCFNCNQPDHQQRECPLPRRDGKDAKGGGGGASYVVSQNHRGKKSRGVGEKKD